MKIRAYHVADTAVLSHIHNQTHAVMHTPESFARYVADMSVGDGRIWVITDTQDIIVGYAIIAPVPGLPDQGEIDGAIAPDYQRQGYGSYLLQHILDHLHHGSICQISHCVSAVDTTAAHFLRHHGFVTEHEEWILARPHLHDLPSLPVRSDCRSATFSTRSRTIRTFCDLYERSFHAYPWYQPYTSDEVAMTLDAPQDVLFLRRDDIPIGFAWLHVRGGVGEIEPFGIVEAWQGQGYGRILFVAALHQLIARAATSAQIGAWRNNQPALHLYQSLGFQYDHTLTYLAHTW